MTIKDLLDVWDHNREDEYQTIHIMDENGKVSMEVHTNCNLLDDIEDKKIKCINIPDTDIIEVWLEKEENE